MTTYQCYCILHFKKCKFMSYIINDWCGLNFCTYLIPDLLCGVHDVSKERIDCCIGHQDVNGPTPIQSLYQTQSQALVHAITQWRQQVEDILTDTCTSPLNAVWVTKAAADVNHALPKRWTVCFHETLTKSCKRHCSDTQSKTQSVLLVWPLSSLKTSVEYNKVKGTPLNTKQSPKGAQRKS